MPPRSRDACRTMRQESLRSAISRGGSPSCADRVRASILGHGAVKALLDGRKGVMVGLINDKIEYTAFDLACSRHNEINKYWYDIARILSI